MQTNRAMQIAKWIVALVIVAIVGALLGWYYFLRTSTQDTAALAEARGFDSGIPAFVGSTGSTDQNIARSLQVGTSTVNAAVARSSGGANMWQVSDMPIAGSGFVGSSTLAYVARSTGYVFSVDPKTRTSTRLTNTLRPKVYEALLGAGGHVIERTVDESGAVVTFIGQVATSSASAENALLGTEIEGVGAVATNAAVDLFVYLQGGRDGVSGFLSGWTAAKQKRIFQNPLTNWRISMLADGRVVLAQKPADGIPGYAYLVGGTGALQLLASGAGLTVLPHASSTALLVGNSSGEGAYSLFALASATSAPRLLNVATIADKCVWAPGKVLIAYCAVPGSIASKTFLDEWYRGASRTMDTWVRIDATTGSTTPLLPATGPSFDVKDPIIDDTGSYLAFTNASDNTLWLVTIPQ